MEAVATAATALASGDDALVERASTGDARAFDALIATRVDRCYRLAYTILGNPSDAADATQEAFVSAWRQLPRLRDRGSFDGWLNRIVANAARMSRRSRSRRVEVRAGTILPLDDGDTARSPEPADARAGQEIESIANADAIGRAFDRLAERDRLILVLHYVEERPVAEIASSLGIPVGTAKWRLHRARAALEQAMETER